LSGLRCLRCLRCLSRLSRLSRLSSCCAGGDSVCVGLLQLTPGRREQALWRAPAVVNGYTVAGETLPERQVPLARDLGRELRRGDSALADHHC
jgi:hypothetical protein